MKSLPPSQLAVFLTIGLVLGLSGVQLLSGFGYPFPVSPWSMIITLPLIGIGVWLASLPIARYRTKLEQYSEGPRPSRPNPFYAFRVLVIARATSLAGALFVGWHLGAVIWLVSFSVAPAALTQPTLFAVAGAIVMLAGGLIAEQNCKTPKDPGEEAK